MPDVHLVNEGGSQYRVEMGKTIIGIVRKTDGEWTAAVMDQGEMNHLPGNYRFRSTALDDIIDEWKALNF